MPAHHTLEAYFDAYLQAAKRLPPTPKVSVWVWEGAALGPVGAT